MERYKSTKGYIKEQTSLCRVESKEGIVVVHSETEQISKLPYGTRLKKLDSRCDDYSCVPVEVISSPEEKFNGHMFFVLLSVLKSSVEQGSLVNGHKKQSCI